MRRTLRLSLVTLFLAAFLSGQLLHAGHSHAEGDVSFVECAVCSLQYHSDDTANVGVLSLLVAESTVTSWAYTHYLRLSSELSLYHSRAPPIFS